MSSNLKNPKITTTSNQKFWCPQLILYSITEFLYPQHSFHTYPSTCWSNCRKQPTNSRTITPLELYELGSSRSGKNSRLDSRGRNFTATTDVIQSFDRLCKHEWYSAMLRFRKRSWRTCGASTWASKWGPKQQFRAILVFTQGLSLFSTHFFFQRAKKTDIIRAFFPLNC